MRILGVEPSSAAWKAAIITVIRYTLLGSIFLNEDTFLNQ